MALDYPDHFNIFYLYSYFIVITVATQLLNVRLAEITNCNGWNA